MARRIAARLPITKPRMLSMNVGTRFCQSRIGSAAMRSITCQGVGTMNLGTPNRGMRNCQMARSERAPRAGGTAREIVEAR